MGSETWVSTSGDSSTLIWVSCRLSILSVFGSSGVVLDLPCEQAADHVRIVLDYINRPIVDKCPKGSSDGSLVASKPTGHSVTVELSGVAVVFEAWGILRGEEHFGPVIVDPPAPLWLDSEREHHPGSGLRRT